MSHYYSGRGLPSYLLSRNYETSSIDSNEASRIFALSSCSTTSDKETDTSSILSHPRTSSYMSTSSSFTWSETTSISTAPSMFEYLISNTGRSIDDETRTHRSETRSMSKESTPRLFARQAWTHKNKQKILYKVKMFHTSISSNLLTIKVLRQLNGLYEYVNIPTQWLTKSKTLSKSSGSILNKRVGSLHLSKSNSREVRNETLMETNFFKPMTNQHWIK